MIKKLLIIYLALLADSAIAYAPNIYFGLDFGKSTYGMKPRYGDNLFYKKSESYNIFAGKMFYEDWFVEFGFEFTENKKKQKTIYAGDYFPGSVIVLPGQHFHIRSQEKLQHPTLLVGNSFSSDKILNRKLEFSAAIGLSWSKLRSRYEITGDDLFPTYHPANIVRRTFNQKKLVPVAKVGAMYNISNCFGIRTGITWRQLSKLKPKSSENPTSSSQVKMRDGVVGSIGLVFCL